MFTVYLLPINTIPLSALKAQILGFKVLLFLSAICWAPPNHHPPMLTPNHLPPLLHVIFCYEDSKIHVFMLKLWACRHYYSLGTIRQSRNFYPPVITGTCKAKQELVCMFLQKSLLQEVNRLELLSWWSQLELVSYGPDFFLHTDYRQMGILTFRFLRYSQTLKLSIVRLAVCPCHSNIVAHLSFQFQSCFFLFCHQILFFYGTLTQHWKLGPDGGV